MTTGSGEKVWLIGNFRHGPIVCDRRRPENDRCDGNDGLE